MVGRVCSVRTLVGPTQRNIYGHKRVRGEEISWIRARIFQEFWVTPHYFAEFRLASPGGQLAVVCWSRGFQTAVNCICIHWGGGRGDSWLGMAPGELELGQAESSPDRPKPQNADLGKCGFSTKPPFQNGELWK